MRAPARLLGNLRTARIRQRGVTWGSVVLFPLRRRLGSRHKRLRLQEGIELRTPAEEPLLTLFREVWIDHRYAEPQFRPRPGATVVDIGANVGVFTVWSARLSPNSRIVAVEPSPRMAATLYQNVVRNGLKNVQVVQLACAGAPGTRTLFRRGPSVLSSLYHRDVIRSEFVPECEVVAVTLGELFRQQQITRCDLLKVDCEGAEYEILLNAPRDVLKKIRQIALEYHVGLNDHQPGELVEYLGQHGFRVRCEPLLDQECGYMYASRPSEEEC